MLPPKSAYLIFELNNSSDELYIGFLRINTPAKNFYTIKKFKLTKQVLNKLQNIQKEQQSIAGMLYKTPLQTEEEAHKMENEQNEKYMEIIKEFNETIAPYFAHIHPLLNEEPPNTYNYMCRLGIL